MRKSFQFILGFLLLFAFCSIYAQSNMLSTGRAPFTKSQNHVVYGTSPLASVAYANDNQTSNNISIPIPDGTPFTVLGTFTAPVFASSMTKGGDGNYYLTDVGPPAALYLFDPGSGTCTLIGSITGMGSDQPNGIAYDPANDSYYMCSSTSLYSLDINTLTATLIGSWSITGLMVDLCFDENGTCFAYDIDITPGAANGYTIDINTAAITPLGYLGFTPNYGQGMSYDYETGTIYLAAFNNDAFAGQLRTMDKVTGMTTLVYQWGDQIAPFALDTQPGPPCPQEAASNPNPPSGASDISVSGTTLTWTNGSGAVSVDVWFGPAGNVQEVYSGSPISSWPTGALEYYTSYSWHVVCHNDTCSNSSGNWTFMTEQNPNLLVVDFYPQSAAYWTGNTEGTTKTDGEINTVYPNVAWAAYDVSAIPESSVVQNVVFYGYVNATNWPYWSATPMGSVNPVTDDAASINSQIQANNTTNLAYIYSDEASTFTTGWHNYPMGNSALPDLQTAVNAGQSWFAMGFIDRDLSTSYYVNFDGWSQPNPPYLEITYVPHIVPVELTSFNADFNNGGVVLNWQTATETNNKGFEVQRNSGNGYQALGFVQGNGTSTQQHSYSFVDKNVESGNYTYRLKQIDFNGKSELSSEVSVNVDIPKVYSLAQNYPNPFNPSTKIDFTLAADSKVTLKVFDILGQEVTTLLSGNMTAGAHNITFDASRLTSGVYLYKIEAKGVDGSNFTSIKKMLLTK